MHIKSLKKLTGIFLLLIVLGLSTASAQNYEIKAFETVGEHSWDVPDNVDKVDVLLVGGGGGGGAARGGGGGAGELINKTVDLSSNDSVDITVGAGGNGGIDQNGINGNNSSFGHLEALGGGGGGMAYYNGKDGGSGGGGGTHNNPGGASLADTGIGSEGGYGPSNVGQTGSAGGGGGATSQGLEPDETSGAYYQLGHGGYGSDLSSTFGTAYGYNGKFAGGGGGGVEGYCGTDTSNVDSNRALGRAGGGDSGLLDSGGSCNDGETYNFMDGTDAVANTGSGGGGGNYDKGNGGDGGSGIVLIRYEGDFIICDRRGLFNECISNSTHSISGQSFNISSIFHSEASSVFEAPDSKATLNVSNSTEISGVWRGSFDILSGVGNSLLKSGASFRPNNGRIVID